MPMTADEVSEKFPVHWLVWNDNYEELRIALNNKKWSSEELESHDPRGRTPLLLAVTLGHHECVRALLAAGANVCCERDGWTAVQEATARGHCGLLAAVLARRDHARHAARVAALPALLRRLSLAPDFYVEMKWEFTSWIPLVSRICPFDTYRVYKRGANVRVDTTLLGFHDNRWERGDRTYIFSGQEPPCADKETQTAAADFNKLTNGQTVILKADEKEDKKKTNVKIANCDSENKLKSNDRSESL